MVASTDIKFYSYSNTNAPQLSNTWGCMIDVLDACLVTGFGSQTVSTMTASGTTVTATFGSAHNFMQYQVIEIAGATPSAYNGQFRILTVPNATTITFQVATAPSASPATGTITCKLPAAGWEKTYAGTQKAAYRSGNTLLASRPFLRVDNALDAAWTTTYAKYAKVAIVESMSDIDTMSGVQAPYDSSAPNKNWVGSGSGTTAYGGWSRWFYAMGSDSPNNAAGSTAPTAGNRRWIIVADDKTFYICNGFTPTETTYCVRGFGYFEPSFPTDSCNNFLQSHVEYYTANTSFLPGITNLTFSSNSGPAYLMLQRKYDQSAVYATASTAAMFSTSLRSGEATAVASAATLGRVFRSSMFIFESFNIPRGRLPIISFIYQAKPYTSLSAVNEDGRMILPLDVSANSSTSSQIAFDLGAL